MSGMTSACAQGKDRNPVRWGLVLGALIAAVTLGCLTPGDRCDTDGFVPFDGTVAACPSSEYYILRFEQPSGTYEKGWKKGLTQWLFTEVRCLPEGTTMLVDGVLSRPSPRRQIDPVNWAKWIRSGSRNVRVKFVGADYTLAEDGREAPPDGFVSLFNGRDLEGWKGICRDEGFNMPGVRRAAVPEKLWEMQARGDTNMRKHWHVRDGVLFFDGQEGGTSIAAKRDYGNLEMIADWRLLRVYGDSGFYLRGCPQVQIWDPNSWGGLGSGGIWNNRNAAFAASLRADRPIGDWNRCRMRLVGDKLTVWLNGTKVVDGVTYENQNQPGAPIPLIDQVELQCHGDPIEFRNIFIRELPEAADDIPDPAAAKRGEPIDLLKDGMDGWEAADPKLRMGWSVKDGVLSNFVTDDPTKTSRGGSGGTHLRTRRTDFFDFDLSYDVLVPRKCNSGVYLRGRYEIQVCDSYGRKPDTHTMAALYDLVAPTVGAEKPAGEWQHVDLTIYRRHITVTLNGVRIIDNRPIAGVTPAAIDWDETVPGPILLQGDHSNASFRNMILTPILGNPKYAEIGPILKESVARGDVAGVVSVVTDPDYAMQIDCVGWADIKRRIPMRPDTMFAMFSSSKSVCGTAVMILVADGKIALDDPVAKYIPEFADIKVEEKGPDGKPRLVPPKRQVTIRDVMSHVSGSRYCPPIVRRDFPLIECARRMARTPLRHQPGETFSYNNAGIDTGGAVVEVVSRMPYEKFCEQRIFRPLGMKDTTFNPNPDQIARLARCYNGDGKPLVDQATVPPPPPDGKKPPKERYADQNELPAGFRIHPAPSAGLYSTPLDFARYSQMLAHHGEWKGVRILPERLFNEVYVVKQTADSIESPYTIGNWIRGEWFGHSGAMKTDQRVNVRTGHSRCYFVQVSPPGGDGFNHGKDAWNVALDRIQCADGATPCLDHTTPRTSGGKVKRGR